MVYTIFLICYIHNCADVYWNKYGFIVNYGNVVLGDVAGEYTRTQELLVVKDIFKKTIEGICVYLSLLEVYVIICQS